LPPKSWSIFAWAAVAASSVVITYLLTLSLGLFFTAFGVMLTVSMLSRDISFGGILLVAFALTVGGTVLWSLIPRKDRSEPEGVPIDLSQEVRLRAELEAIAQTMNERLPSEIYLVPVANAAVLERTGRFGRRRIMLLGLPLLQMLSVSQFRAILAHEFAHFYAGDTRLGPWVFQARDKMARVVTGLGRDSMVLAVLRKWAVIALLHMIVVGGLILYWKLLTRITQYISRRQEFRCDELACYVAGSQSLAEGLCNIHRAAATFGAYWSHVVAPVAANGFRPPLADGYARFMTAPAIAKAAAAALETQLAGGAADPLNSHPPLNARLEKARSLAIPARHNDERPAVTLIDDLPSLEQLLLKKLAPDVNVAGLKSIHWDSAGAEVYIPLWRSMTAPLQPLLAQRTVSALPDALSLLPELTNRIPDPPGTLLTREQRMGRAVEALSYMLTLTLVDHGWQLYLQPGQFYLERDGVKLESGSVVANLKSGKLTAASWVEYCHKNGIGDWPLSGVSTF
jgi:Zn-dependent protease with chaperone function